MTTSPWGKPETIRELAPGIQKITTGSHGGIHLSRTRQQALPDDLRAEWFEEDVQWAIPFAAFAEELPPQDVWFAIQTLRRENQADRFPKAVQIAQAWEKEHQGQFLMGTYLFDGKSRMACQTYDEIGGPARLQIRWDTSSTRPATPFLAPRETLESLGALESAPCEACPA